MSRISNKRQLIICWICRHGNQSIYQVRTNHIQTGHYCTNIIKKILRWVHYHSVQCRLVLIDLQCVTSSQNRTVCTAVKNAVKKSLVVCHRQAPERCTMISVAAAPFFELGYHVAVVRARWAYRTAYYIVFVDDITDGCYPSSLIVSMFGKVMVEVEDDWNIEFLLVKQPHDVGSVLRRPVHYEYELPSGISPYPVFHLPGLLMKNIPSVRRVVCDHFWFIPAYRIPFHFPEPVIHVVKRWEFHFDFPVT